MAVASVGGGEAYKGRKRTVKQILRVSNLRCWSYDGLNLFFHDQSSLSGLDYRQCLLKACCQIWLSATSEGEAESLAIPAAMAASDRAFSCWNSGLGIAFETLSYQRPGPADTILLWAQWLLQKSLTRGKITHRKDTVRTW